jgi:hypothetical protein
MPRNDEAELEMALGQEFRDDFESEEEFEREMKAPAPQPKRAPQQPAGALARGLYAQYQTACKGRRILEVLRKQNLNPIDEALMLEDRIQRLPLLFDRLAELNQMHNMPPGVRRVIYNRLIALLGYPPDVYLGTLDDALAQARCELAESRWRAVAPARRMIP